MLIHFPSSDPPTVGHLKHNYGIHLVAQWQLPHGGDGLRPTTRPARAPPRWTGRRAPGLSARQWRPASPRATSSCRWSCVTARWPTGVLRRGEGGHGFGLDWQAAGGFNFFPRMFAFLFLRPRIHALFVAFGNVFTRWLDFFIGRLNHTFVSLVQKRTKGGWSPLSLPSVPSQD